MKQYTCQVMSTGIQAIKLTVQHVRNPRQGVAIGVIESCNGPSEPFEGKSGLHMFIVSDVIQVIEIDKVVVPDLSIDHDGSSSEEQADEKSSVA